MANGGNNNGNGQIIPFSKRVDDLRGLLAKMKDQFAMALPRHVSVDRFLRVVMTATQKTPQLVDCEWRTFLGALLECCQLGLEPNTSLGHAWLVPFRNNKRGGRLEAQVIPGYKGLIRLAYNSGQVSSIAAHVVRENDDFEYRLGTRPRIHHVRERSKDAGPMVAVYATADVKISQRAQFIVLERWECEEIRENFSKARNEGPWVTNFVEMSMKSAVRRLCKWIPSDTQNNALARAVTLDDHAEAGIEQEFDSVIDLGVDAVREVGGDGQPPADDKPAEAAATPAAGSKLEKLAADAEQRRASSKS